MASRTKKQPNTWLLWGLVVVVCALATLMFVPINVALSSGLAATSLLVFPLAIGLVFGAIFFFHVTSTWLRAGLALSIVLAATSSVIPQTYFADSAKTVGVRLTWNPLSYARFSGSTTISPDKTLVYKQAGNQELSLAVYGKTTGELKPAVLLLHGGGWRYGNFLQTGRWPELLSRSGFVVVSAQYRLSAPGNPTWQQAPADVHDAFEYMQTNANALGIDKQRITLMGQSAGGHLALLEAYKNPKARSVVSLYAPVDLAYDYESSRDKSSEATFIGGSPSQYPQRYGELSPPSYVKQTSPRTLLVQGQRDDLVAVPNATALAERLEDFGVEHQLLLLPLTGHSFENQHGGFASQIAEHVVVDFLTR